MTSARLTRFLPRPILVGLVCSLALAPSIAGAAPDWTTAQRINEVVIDDSFTTVIIPPINNPMGCGVPTFLRVGKADSNYESMTAAILSAQAQGRNVRLYAAACYGDNSVRITGIWIQP